jgi:rhodanese-related sulfurtransferase
MTAHDYFSRRLAFETDAADVAEALRDGSPDFVLVDARNERAYTDAHLPGAISLARRGVDGLPPGPIVVYCWGPGCNGATKAAARLSALGREVKEMLGGFEYYVREGHPVEGERAPEHRPDASGLVCSLA